MTTNGGTASTSSTSARARRRAPAVPFLAQTAEPVREQLAAAVTLGEFLAGAGTLTIKQRSLLVEQALVLMELNYVHLPLKVAMHAVNPVQRLRLLRTRLERQTTATMDPEWQFHAELSEVFHSVRDLHTNYLLPEPFSGKIAFLPFLVEEYFDDPADRSAQKDAGGAAHYVVSHVVQGFDEPPFGIGVELTHWNGVPIDRAVDINADRFAGSNAAARHARGVESLTVRSLRLHLPPDEHWVVVTYLGPDGTSCELRHPWLVVDNLPPMADGTTASAHAAAVGLDLGADEIGRAKRLLFAPESFTTAQAADDQVDGAADQSPPSDAPAAPAPATPAVPVEVPSNQPAVFRARSVETTAGTFGHLRIFTFSVDDPEAFVAEFIRLVGLLPQNGLILDVRGNGGGHIFASEFTLQTMTPRHIEPEPVQFVNSPLNLELCRRHRDNPIGIDLGPWLPSMEQGVETGSAFSGAFPITPTEGANAQGQHYWGPVVLVIDARCYSATDIFSAGFQDHAIGPVLGVDANTGAGGANVWTQTLLKQLMEQPEKASDSPYKALPKGAGMRVAIRRSLRVGALAGTPVEDLGITPDVRHQLTRRDVLEGNQDLFEVAGGLLAAAPARRLDVTATAKGDGQLVVEVATAGLDRVDVFVDDRPRGSLDVTGPDASLTLEGIGSATTVRVEGYAAGQLVAARTVTPLTPASPPTPASPVTPGTA